MLHSLFCLLPIKNLSLWQPSLTDIPTSKSRRVYDGRRAYNWDSDTGKATDVLPPELVTPRTSCATSVRVMVMVCDEGSQGFSLFWWLATHVRLSLRCIFIRDPPHKMSNVFINSLRGVFPLFRSVMDVLQIHKYKRAPFGGGRFWRAARETLVLLLSTLNREPHAVMLIYAAAIERDLGLTSGTLDDISQYKSQLIRVANMSVGSRVEMRRWYSYYDAAVELDQTWHSMLLALVVETLCAGEDPWVIAATACLGRCLQGQGCLIDSRFTQIWFAC